MTIKKLDGIIKLENEGGQKMEKEKSFEEWLKENYNIDEEDLPKDKYDSYFIEYERYLEEVKNL